MCVFFIKQPVSQLFNVSEPWMAEKSIESACVKVNFVVLLAGIHPPPQLLVSWVYLPQVNEGRLFIFLSLICSKHIAYQDKHENKLYFGLFSSFCINWVRFL